MTHSALYQGTVRHRRIAVRAHELHHRVGLAYIDLDELPRLLGGRLVGARPRLVRFERGDMLGDPDVPLGIAVRELVAERVGVAPSGPVRVLTHLRSFGHCFNPVSFYYLFDRAGDRVDAVVAEVTSTPWGERHAYVVARTGDGPVLTGRMDKRMHVSPFMGMDQHYLLHAATPGPTLAVHIESREDDRAVFDATLALRRVALTRRSLARATARHPAATVRLLALIYGHAVALAAKRVPIHRHPAHPEVT